MSIFNVQEHLSESALLTVISRLVALRKLFADTEAALRRIPGIDENLFIKRIPRLARVIDFNSLVEVSWDTYADYLGVEDITALRFGENLLFQFPEAVENIIPTEELRDLLNEVDKMIESMLASSLPTELKNSLFDLLHEIRKAILEYRIRGAVTLKEALTKSVGILAVNKEAMDENKDSHEIQSLGRMLIRIDKLYTFAVKMKPLLEAALNFFPVIASHIK